MSYGSLPEASLYSQRQLYGNVNLYKSTVVTTSRPATHANSRPIFLSRTCRTTTSTTRLFDTLYGGMLVQVYIKVYMLQYCLFCAVDTSVCLKSRTRTYKGVGACQHRNFVQITKLVIAWIDLSPIRYGVSRPSRLNFFIGGQAFDTLIHRMQFIKLRGGLLSSQLSVSKSNRRHLYKVQSYAGCVELTIDTEER